MKKNVLAIIVVSILLNLLIAGIVTKPIRKTIEVIHKIAEGDTLLAIADLYYGDSHMVAAILKANFDREHANRAPMEQAAADTLACTGCRAAP